MLQQRRSTNRAQTSYCRLASPHLQSAGLGILERSPPLAGWRIPYGSAPQQFGDLRLPAGNGSHPLMVMIHGGYWRARYDLAHTGHLCAALTAAGVATWNIEYRRLGQPGGGWPGTFLDVGAAIDFVRELATRFPLDLARVVVLGHSAGGQLALWSGARPGLAGPEGLGGRQPLPLRAVAGLAPVSDLRRGWELGLSGGVIEELLAGTPDQVPQRYAEASPIARLPLGVRQLLVHGTVDDTVPYELSQRYWETATALDEPIEILTLEGAGHFEVIDPASQQWPQIEERLLQLVRQDALAPRQHRKERHSNDSR